MSKICNAKTFIVKSLTKFKGFQASNFTKLKENSTLTREGQL